MLIRYDTALVILLSALFATFLYYYVITRFCKRIKGNTIQITTVVLFVIFSIVSAWVHLTPYKSSQIYINILRSIFSLASHLGFILLVYLGFQRIYKFITKRG